MSDPIKAAIEAAAQAVCRWPDGLSCNSSQPSPACENCTGHAAAAVAAFLRALPPEFHALVRFDSGNVDPVFFAEDWELLAAAVEREAQEDKR
jgi:hypothetical protein